MQSRAKLLGQPLNPVLTLLPLGILTSTVIADLGALLSGWTIFAVLTKADMMVGLLSGVVALCALLVDLLTAPPGSRARSVLNLVCSAYAGMVVVFTAVWSLHGDGSRQVTYFLAELVALAAGISGGALASGLARGRAPGRLPLSDPLEEAPVEVPLLQLLQ